MKSLAAEYERRHDEVLRPLATRLEAHIRELATGLKRVDRVTARAKSVDRFVAKASKIVDGRPKYENPLREIQDQVGARIVVYYKRDVEPVRQLITEHFRAIEDLQKEPESEREFAYFGQHYILFIPTEILPALPARAHSPTFFELQIKTLFQHAWAEAEHDLSYKPFTPVSTDQKRRIAWAAAQAWGADEIFNQLFGELNPHEAGIVQLSLLSSGDSGESSPDR